MIVILLNLIWQIWFFKIMSSPNKYAFRMIFLLIIVSIISYFLYMLNHFYISFIPIYNLWYNCIHVASIFIHFLYIVALFLKRPSKLLASNDPHPAKKTCCLTHGRCISLLHIFIVYLYCILSLLHIFVAYLHCIYSSHIFIAYLYCIS